MNPVQQNPIEAAHQNLQNVLLNGRILINGLPLTGNELGGVVRGEQLLYEKAVKLDKALTPDKEPSVKYPKTPKKQPENK